MIDALAKLVGSYLPSKGTVTVPSQSRQHEGVAARHRRRSGLIVMRLPGWTRSSGGLSSPICGSRVGLELSSMA